MSNPWLTHVAEFRKKHPGMAYKDVLKEAKKTYTPVTTAKRSPSGVTVKRSVKVKIGVPPQRGGADGDLIDAVNKLDDDQRINAGLKLAQLGTRFAGKILDSEPRVKRTTERSTRRDTRASRRGERRQDRKDRRTDRREARKDRRVTRREGRKRNVRARDKARDEEIKQAEHKMRLKEILGE